MALSSPIRGSFSAPEWLPYEFPPCIPSAQITRKCLAGSPQAALFCCHGDSEKCRPMEASISNVVGKQLSGIVRSAPTVSNFGRITGNVACQAHERENGLYMLSDYDGEGPIELPPREVEMDPFAIPEAGPIQITASYVLTGAIGVLLFRALRRRAARTKETQFRSSGISAKLKAEAKEAVMDKIQKAPEISVPPPSPAKTAVGALVAGIIALGLYKFTTSVEAAFSVKEVSQNYSIRNLTITVRSIISGLCYLATFVFAANSIGLMLYFIQLLLGFGVPDPPLPTDPSKNDDSLSEQIEEDK